MTVNTSQTVASRLGYSLGRAVRAVWYSENRTLRWVKRLALIALAVYSWVWLAHAVIAALTVGLILLAVVLGGGLRPAVVSANVYKPFQSEYDNDPYSLGNQNNSLFHAKYEDNFLN